MPRDATDRGAPARRSGGGGTSPGAAVEPPRRSPGGLVLAAPDKFRGTLTAAEAAGAIAAGASRAGWEALELPLSDGGEGLLEAVGGVRRRSLVAGPDGRPVQAEWRLLDGGGGRRAGERHGNGSDRRGKDRHGKVTAVIEMARASGLALAGGPARNDPVAASTRGTGELVAAAVRAGADRVVVGCGGSATTDGGAGALEAIEGLLGPAGLEDVELLAATDVTTGFLEAAATFAPQKGADPSQVAELATRLATLAGRYERERGVDVTVLTGAGAAGGLAGGLAALGARIVSGFELVAELAGLDEALARADAVVTGEGCLDATSFAGKVVGALRERWLSRGGRDGEALLCVAGAVTAAGEALAASSGLQVVSLSARYGRRRALGETAALLTETVAGWLPTAAPLRQTAEPDRRGLPG